MSIISEFFNNFNQIRSNRDRIKNFLVAEGDTDLLKKFESTKIKYYLEVAIIISGITIVGYIWLWVLSIIWFKYRNAENELFVQWEDKYNPDTKTWDDTILYYKKANMVKTILFLLLVIPLFGYAIVLVFSILTIGLLILGYVKYTSGTYFRINETLIHSIMTVSYHVNREREQQDEYQEQQQLTEKRSDLIKKVLKRTRKISIDKLTDLMEFNSSKDLLEWIYNLPDDFPVLIDGSEVLFKWESTDDVTVMIDTLLDDYSKWESEHKGKI